MSDCPICQQGTLTERISMHPELGIESHYSVCSSCGSEQVNAEQAKINKQFREQLEKGKPQYLRYKGIIFKFLP